MEATIQAAPKRRRREETRQRLLTSALGVFARNGYERATVDEIVRDAGFSKGAFYVHFKSKDDLFWTMLEERILHHQEAFRQSVDPGSSFHQNVRRLLTAIFDLESENPSWPAIVMEFVAHAGRNSDIRERFATIYKSWREVIVAMLREGQAAGQVRGDIDLAFSASAAIALIEGTITQSRLAPNEIVLDQMIDPLCALLAQALEKPA